MADEYATSQDFLNLTDLRGDAHYLAYVVKRRLTESAESAQGTSIKGITKPEVLALPIGVPSTEEQQAISTVLLALDRIINSTQNRSESLTSLKRTMLVKMFPQGTASTPEVRFDWFEGDWTPLTLGEHARFTKGAGYSKGDLVKAGQPIFLYGRLYTRYQTEFTDIDTFVNAGSNGLLSRGGEVLVPASGESSEDIARASVLSQPGVLIGGDLNVIYPSTRIDPVFLALAISGGRTQQELAAKAQGKTVVHVRNSDIQNLVVHTPSLPEQRAIGSYFRSLDALIGAEEKKLATLRNLKSALLTQMFV